MELWTELSPRSANSIHISTASLKFWQAVFSGSMAAEHASAGICCKCAYTDKLHLMCILHISILYVAFSVLINRNKMKMGQREGQVSECVCGDANTRAVQVCKREVFFLLWFLKSNNRQKICDTDLTVVELTKLFEQQYFSMCFLTCDDASLYQTFVSLF